MIERRRWPRKFLYAVRRDLTLPRNFVIAENYRRFWRRHRWQRLVLATSDIQDWTR